MDAKNLLDGIIADVISAKESEARTVDIDNLLNYLKGIDIEKFKDRPSFELENFKHSKQYEIEVFKIENAAQLEAFKSVITVGANACRAFMIMNGGAAIALLAFLGNIWNKNSTPDAAKGIAISLGVFCFGVIASGFCAGFTYLAQSFYGNSLLGVNKRWLNAGHFVNALACLSGLLSLFAFGYGAYSAFSAMSAQLIMK